MIQVLGFSVLLFLMNGYCPLNLQIYNVMVPFRIKEDVLFLNTL